MGRFVKERVVKVVCQAAAVFCTAAIIIICTFLLVNGVPAISEIGVKEFLFGAVWKPSNDRYGIFPMIIGSVFVTAGALAAGIPLGLFTAIYLAYFCPKKWYPLLKRALMLLAGIPSVIYGFFGIVVLVPLISNLSAVSGKNMITASVLLGIMILPTMTSITESSLRAVPRTYYEGAMALGSDHVRSVFKIILPAAKTGVMTGVMLSLGRAVGETMAVIMVAGNQARIPKRITQGVRTLTANIALEMGYAADLHREALIATALVLLVFILLIHIIFAIWKRRR